MPQTLLAIFAILTVSILSLNQQQASTHARLQMIRTEIETQAETVVFEMMEDFRALPFDEAVRLGTTINAASDFTALSPTKVAYDSKQRTLSFSQVNDLGDLKQARTETVEREGKHGTIAFDVNFDVRYVRQQAGSDQVEVTSTKTYTKEVVVEISHPMLSNPISLSRIFSYQQ